MLLHWAASQVTLLLEEVTELCRKLLLPFSPLPCPIPFAFHAGITGRRGVGFLQGCGSVGATQRSALQTPTMASSKTRGCSFFPGARKKGCSSCLEFCRDALVGSFLWDSCPVSLAVGTRGSFVWVQGWNGTVLRNGRFFPSICEFCRCFHAGAPVVFSSVFRLWGCHKAQHGSGMYKSIFSTVRSSSLLLE